MSTFTNTRARQLAYAGLACLVAAIAAPTAASAKSEPKDPPPKTKFEASQMYLLKGSDGSMFRVSGSNLSRIAIIAEDKCKKCLVLPVAGGKVFVPSDRLNGYRLPAGETAKVNTDLNKLGQPRTLNGQVVLQATVGQ